MGEHYRNLVERAKAFEVMTNKTITLDQCEEEMSLTGGIAVGVNIVFYGIKLLLLSIQHKTSFKAEFLRDLSIISKRFQQKGQKNNVNITNSNANDVIIHMNEFMSTGTQNMHNRI